MEFGRHHPLDQARAEPGAAADGGHRAALFLPSQNEWIVAAMGARFPGNCHGTTGHRQRAVLGRIACQFVDAQRERQCLTVPDRHSRAGDIEAGEIVLEGAQCFGDDDGNIGVIPVFLQNQVLRAGHRRDPCFKALARLGRGGVSAKGLAGDGLKDGKAVLDPVCKFLGDNPGHPFRVNFGGGFDHRVEHPHHPAMGIAQRAVAEREPRLFRAAAAFDRQRAILDERGLAGKGTIRKGFDVLQDFGP